MSGEWLWKGEHKWLIISAYFLLPAQRDLVYVGGKKGDEKMECIKYFTTHTHTHYTHTPTHARTHRGLGIDVCVCVKQWREEYRLVVVEGVVQTCPALRLKK